MAADQSSISLLSVWLCIFTGLVSYSAVGYLPSSYSPAIPGGTLHPRRGLCIPGGRGAASQAGVETVPPRGDLCIPSQSQHFKASPLYIGVFPCTWRMCALKHFKVQASPSMSSSFSLCPRRSPVTIFILLQPPVNLGVHVFNPSALVWGLPTCQLLCDFLTQTVLRSQVLNPIIVNLYVVSRNFSSWLIHVMRIYWSWTMSEAVCLRKGVMGTSKTSSLHSWRF